MINILLDELPTSYEGYEIETDFRIGIMLSMAMSDKDLSNEEKYYTALRLLFKDEYPEGEEVANCINWFLNGWNYDNNEKQTGQPIMDFDLDAGRIFSAFMSQYNINLNLVEMHWWQFMIMLSCLNECALTNVMDIRSKDLSKLDKNQRKFYEKEKRRYAIKHETEADKIAKQETDDKFLRQMGMK